MKRNDDGYVLPLVLVVLLVLGIVVSSVLSASLRNLQVQNNAIQRSEAKYEAEGVIEIVKAELLDLVDTKSTDPEMDVNTDGSKTVKKTNMLPVINDKIATFVPTSTGLTVSIPKITDLEWKETVTNDTIKFEFPLSVEVQNDDGTVSISCKLQASGTIKPGKETVTENGQEKEKDICAVETIKIEYVSYEIGGAA